MKRSIYNIFIPTKNHSKYIAYNTLVGSVSVVNTELKDAILHNELPQDEEILNELRETNLVVDDKIDEKKVYKYMHNRYKHDNSYQHFCVVITYDCNFRCPYCYQGANKSREPMSDEMVDKVISFIKNTCMERKARDLEITLYGGEPFLCPEICKKLVEETSKWAGVHGIVFHLSALTNGSLLTKELVDWLSSYNARVQIPLDGFKTVHDKYRRYCYENTGSYEDLIKVFEYFKDSDASLHLRISVTTETYPTMEQMLDDLKRRGLTHLHPDFCYITSFVEACNSFSKYCLKDSELYKVLPELWRMSRKKGFKTDLLRPRVSPLPCSSIADGSYVIDPIGDIYKCWELVIQKDHVVGAISENGELEMTPPYHDTLARDPTTIDGCKDCKFLPACSGGCICKACWNNGTYHASGCGSVRFLLIEQLKAYLLQEYPEKFSKLLE
ncbi:radical SAM protein [Candidatus Micrarchaeota archaeon]|nr:radical SAM protein [Candidatus Micrarchaeota archaeon]